MRVDDCDDSPLAGEPIPESGRFVNPGLANAPENDPRRSLTERVYRFLERVRFVVPITREKPRHRSPSTR